jgi:2-methylcitrate dehydratase PrpD
MGLTKELAEFVAGLEFGAIPEAGVAVARLGFIDCFGVMIAGGTEPAIGILAATVLAGEERQESSLFHCAQRVSAPSAAWINGTAAHALDYDDAPGHRSAVLVPALLAEAQAIGASGQATIAAYVAGYEVWAELAGREKDQLHEKGWHPTGVYGAIAAAAAVARLRGMDAARTANALGIAASQACGLVANFGSMVKPFHAGNSARAGIFSARLAQNGLLASDDAIESDHGFLAAVSQHGNVDRLSPASRLGSDWRIVRDGLSIKRYPICYCAHRATDAMIDLARTHSLRAEDVQQIHAHIGKTQLAILDAHDPQDSLQAKFSIEFAMASALSRGSVTLNELTDTVVRDAEIQALMRKVRTSEIDEYDSQMSQYAIHDFVEVVTRQGTTLRSDKVTRAKGHISRPLERSELLEKFSACLRFGGSRLDAERTFAHFENLPNQPPGWTDMLAPARPHGG